MSKVIDLTGNSYGSLTVIKRAKSKRLPSGQLKTKWSCRCACGNTKDIASDSLRRGLSKTCGACVTNKDQSSLVDIPEVRAANTAYLSGGSLRHGLSNHRLYGRWVSIVNRCHQPDCPSYPKYGARGIKVCTEWLSLHKFIEDNEPLYTKGYEIDRIDNDKGYSPENTRWVTRTKNLHNAGPMKRGKIKYKGVSLAKNATQYRANIYAGRQVHLGLFDCPIDAARAYDKAAESMRGEFAWLNRDYFKEV